MTAQFIAQTSWASSSGSVSGNQSPTSALTLVAGDTVEIQILTRNGQAPTSVTDNLGNSYNQKTPSYNDGSLYGMYVYVADNVAAGSCTPVVAGPNTFSLLCRQMRGLAASASCLGFALTKLAGNGTTGANLATSGAVNIGSSAVNVLVLGLSFDTNAHGVPTTGTSPIAFTAGAAVWGNLTSGTAYTATEYAYITGASGNIAATFGVVSGNDYDTFLTSVTIYQEAPSSSSYNATIKAIAVVPGEVTSNVASAAYTITNPTSYVPAPASTVGYNTKTFDSTTINSVIGGLYPFNFFSSGTPGYTQNSDGSFTCTGTGNTYAATVSSAQYNSSKPQKWAGKVFGGGGYFEVTASFTGTQSGDSLDPLWLLDILSSTGVTNEKVVGYQGIEVDCFEMNVAGSTTQAGFSLHNYYCVTAGTKSKVDPVGIVSPVTVPNPGFTSGTSCKYGFLWVPATSSTQGYAQLYFNGQAVGSPVYWNQYNSSEALPPAGANIANIIDTLKLHFIIGSSNTATPLKVTSVKVWQASDANNATA